MNSKWLLCLQTYVAGVFLVRVNVCLLTMKISCSCVTDHVQCGRFSSATQRLQSWRSLTTKVLTAMSKAVRDGLLGFVSLVPRLDRALSWEVDLYVTVVTHTNVSIILQDTDDFSFVSPVRRRTIFS